MESIAAHKGILSASAALRLASTATAALKGVRVAMKGAKVYGAPGGADGEHP